MYMVPPFFFLSCLPFTLTIPVLAKPLLKVFDSLDNANFTCEIVIFQVTLQMKGADLMFDLKPKSVGNVNF